MLFNTSFRDHALDKGIADVSGVSKHLVHGFDFSTSTLL
jgi:hypothetical protein